MASQVSSHSPQIPLAGEEELTRAFSALAHAPDPLRPAFEAQLRRALQEELAVQAARRDRRPWWLAWLGGRGASQRTMSMRFALAGVAVIMLLVLTGVFVTQLYPLQTGVQLATINVKAGEVEITRLVRFVGDIALTRRIPLSAGQAVQLRPGDELTSNHAADAEIALHDGSRVTLGPGVELAFSEFQARTATKPLVVAMRVDQGEVRSQVEHLQVDHDRFEVSTPNLVAQVRGTVFRVDVRSAGTRVATDKGVVRVNWDGQTLDVEAGRELQVLLGASVPEVHVRPQSPDLSYHLSGMEPDVNGQGEQVIYTNELLIPWRIQTLPGVKVLLIVDDEPFVSAVAGSDGVVDVGLDLAQEGVHRITAVMETLSGERSLPAPVQVLVIDRTQPS
jgi:hypothetical protein